MHTQGMPNIYWFIIVAAKEDKPEIIKDIKVPTEQNIRRSLIQAKSVNSIASSIRSTTTEKRVIITELVRVIRGFILVAISFAQGIE